MAPPQVSQRVRLKAATFGQDIAGADAAGEGPLKYKVNPDIVAQLYERIIMPMTKEVQVRGGAHTYCKQELLWGSTQSDVEDDMHLLSQLRSTGSAVQGHLPTV